MTDPTPRARTQSVQLNPALALYVFAWSASLVTLFIIGPLVGLTYRSWAEYYRSMGKLLWMWGTAFSVAFAAAVGFLAIRGLLIASVKSFVLRLTRIEVVLLLLFVGNLAWGGIGLLQGYPSSYVFGDTLRGLFIPVLYWIVKRSVVSSDHALFLAKMILWGETILLCALVPTDFIPFSFAGRTFLTTVFFTLLFEERSAANRIWYVLLVLFGIYTILTTAAQRGIILIFFVIIILNYVFRLREIRFTIVVFAFLLPATCLFALNQFLELHLERDVDIAAGRFATSLGVRGRARYFGLDESLFQRVGETIDVGRTFASHSPVYLLTGFGNGAILENKLITPSEFSVYKTTKKHNLYITAVALLFRNGVIGAFLFGALGLYLLRILLAMRKFRRSLAQNRKYVYLKVLTLYQVSVFLMSFIAYWYIGNIIVAFTIPLIEFLRRDMVEAATQSTVVS